MLTVTNLHKRFGAQVILAGVNWFVPRDARVALVGANGSGKSTFLRILAGEVEADNGSVAKAKGTTVGYLPQETLGISGHTVRAEAMTAFEHIHAIADECRRLELALAECASDAPEHEALMRAYTAAREAWDAHGSYDLEQRTESVLAGLGFRPDDFARDCGEFSGGWQMRLALAKLLLRRPHLLLLDEPTNHLDLEARNWLESFLRDYPHTVILVAHDRYFLDQTATRISELSRGTLSDFECDYSHYLDAREERLRQQAEAYRQQAEEIARIEAFISRFRAQASKAALVQSRIKQLEKMERIASPEGVRSVHFRFPQPPRSGRLVLELRGAWKRYGDLVVYAGADLAIERGRKVALVGPNGAGKSTLMRLLAGVEPLDDGERRVGHNVSLSYFAQDRGATLEPDKTVLEVVTAAAPLEIVPEVRTLLGAFLFSGDAVYKKTRVLSGGERSRLALATLLLRPTNCLLLDEPTNHLDLSAKEVLLDALLTYSGTLVFVAHDRYFLDRLPNEVVDVGHGGVVRYFGNYEDYLAKKATETDTGRPVTPMRAAAPPRACEAIVTPGAERTAAKRAAREAAKRARQLADLEALITAKEAQLGTVGAVINAPDFYHTHANPHAVFSEFAQLQAQIEALYGRLERLEENPDPIDTPCESGARARRSAPAPQAPKSAEEQS
jgi:ATP-binding cassette subfamily F protein 3